MVVIPGGSWKLSKVLCDSLTCPINAKGYSKESILQCFLPKYDLHNTPQSKPETTLRDAEAAACSTKDVAGRELKPVVLASVESRTGSVNSCPGFTWMLINLPALLLPCSMSICPTPWMLAGNGSFTQDTFPLDLQIHGLCYFPSRDSTQESHRWNPSKLLEVPFLAALAQGSNGSLRLYPWSFF